MTRERLVWGGLLLAFSVFLLFQAFREGSTVGRVYVKGGETVTASTSIVRYREVPPGTPEAFVSVERTLGLWLAALFTLCILSYLYRDNLFYKITESIVVGVSAGYGLVVGFWDSIVAQLMLKLSPALVRSWALPTKETNEAVTQAIMAAQSAAAASSAAADPLAAVTGTAMIDASFVPQIPVFEAPDWSYLIPLILGLLLFSRLSPSLGWLSRWPIAFVVGTTAGLKLILVLDSDLINQIRATILPLVVLNDGAIDPLLSLRNTLLVVGVIASLTYFFFSVEHKGVVGRVTRVGVWVLMITFGASFAFTVMGRITLLTLRLQFLFGDWLGLIPPLGS